MPHQCRRIPRWFHQVVVVTLLLCLICFAPVGSTAAQVDTAPIIHIVSWGETLFSITMRYGVTTQAIINANNLANPDKLYAGQQLIIPAAGGVSSVTHVVQAGENLYRIGLKYGLTVAELVAANNLSDPNQITAGQVLVIPTGGTSAPTSSNSNPASTYTVQRGDTLFRIAIRFNVPLSALIASNGITSPDHIYAGQVLQIPASNVSAPSGYTPPTTVTTGKQIVVDLSEQRVYAFVDDQLVQQFVVSTGLSATPTVIGDYAIYLKYDSQTMSGPGYSYPNVPWVMYFYRGYSFHGTYWHNNFGQPMSRGCVNMRIGEAEWLYKWAPIGTPVHVQH